MTCDLPLWPSSSSKFLVRLDQGHGVLFLAQDANSSPAPEAVHKGISYTVARTPNASAAYHSTELRWSELERAFDTPEARPAQPALDDVV